MLLLWLWMRWLLLVRLLLLLLWMKGLLWLLVELLLPLHLAVGLI